MEEQRDTCSRIKGGIQEKFGQEMGLENSSQNTARAVLKLTRSDLQGLYRLDENGKITLFPFVSSPCYTFYVEDQSTTYISISYAGPH